MDCSRAAPLTDNHDSMIMTPGLRKFALTAHVTSSVGWLGAVAGFLALAVAGLTSHDAQKVRAAYLAMELTGWFVIVPLSIASPLTGLVQSLGSTWGLFRHYWVLIKFLQHPRHPAFALASAAGRPSGAGRCRDDTLPGRSRWAANTTRRRCRCRIRGVAHCDDVVGVQAPRDDAVRAA